MTSPARFAGSGSRYGGDGDPVEIAIGGRKLGPMVLAEVHCGGEDYRDDIAVLVFGPAALAADA